MLKLYCGYIHTSPCMINRNWGLKRLLLQVNGHFSFPPCSEQLSEIHANEIKHAHSSVGIDIVVYPRYD